MSRHDRYHRRPMVTHSLARRGAPGALLTALGVLLAACVSTAVTPSPSFSPPPARSDSPSPTSSPTPIPTPSPTPTPVPTPTPIPLDQSLLTSRVTVLVVGTDSNEDRASRGLAVNTDSMLVASIDPDQEQISVVALPRDTVDVPLGNGQTYVGKVNSIYRTYDIDTLQRALSTLYGIPIDYHVEINMSDFGRLVAAIGGIDVTVTQGIYDDHLKFYLDPGTYNLGPNDAGRYVRSRHSAGGDYGRGQRQMDVLVQIVRKATDPGRDLNLRAIYEAFTSIKTDIPLAKLPTFVELARRSRDAVVVTQVLRPPRFAVFEGIDGARGWVMIPNIPAMRSFVQALMPG